MPTMAHDQSPEVTGDYHCPHCGERAHFRGYDRWGYGGPECCTCGKPDDCTCSTLLVQDFEILGPSQDGDPLPDIEYDSHEGGGSGAVIGRYTTIQCRTCQGVVWEELRGR